MEPSAKKTAGVNKILVAVAAVAIVVVVVLAVVLLKGGEETSDGIGYAVDAKVMTDQNALQEAMNQAMANAENGQVALRYKNNAYSTDGKNFQCYLVNSENNAYDAYFAIYTDATMTDQIYLSELVPPGSGFEEITLDSALETGDHTVYVMLSQVDTDEDGAQTLVGQVTYTMEFHVTEE